MTGSPGPSGQLPQAPPRHARVGPVVPVILVAGAMAPMSQVDAVASFAAVFWLLGFALTSVALVLAVRESRDVGRRPR